MKSIIKKSFVFFIILNSAILSGTSLPTKNNNNFQLKINEDFDPLVDIRITFEIIAIRALDQIDTTSDPDFFVKLYINEEEFISPIWNDKKQLYDCWNITSDVPDDIEKVEISIQLWDWNQDSNKICDIYKGNNKNDNI